MSDNRVKKISDFWSKTELQQNAGNFYMSPITRPYIIESAFGADHVESYKDNSYFAVDIFINDFLAKTNKKICTILSLCCGFGYVERRFVALLPDVKKCIGLDIADGALEVARTRAQKEGLDNISYINSDLNAYEWEESAFDLVIANGALHHISNLEYVVAGIHKTLKPGGILFSCECVCPSYVNHSNRQLQLINSSYFLLPPELRSKKGLPFHKNDRLFRLITKIYSIAARNERSEWSDRKKLISRLIKKIIKVSVHDFNFGVVFISPMKYLLRNDPTECVRSSDIIPVVKSIFSDVSIRVFGGGILQHILDENFFDNYDGSNPSHYKTLEMLCHLEKHFMAIGELGPENSFIFATKTNSD